jgi:hypothetical protein
MGGDAMSLPAHLSQSYRKAFRYHLQRVPVFRLPHEPAACVWGVTKGSEIMRKILRRVLERLRAATYGTLGKRVPTRGSVHNAQRMHPVLVPARSASRR